MYHDSENLSEEDVKNIIADFGSILEWQKYNRESIKDDLEQELKATAYLMTGHAAGLLGCLTFLKDYDPTKSLIHGVGTVIAIFSAGFTLSALALVLFFVVRVNVKATFEFREPLPISAMMAFRYLQALSLLVLVIAVLVIAVKVVRI
jgi:heme/copper-type cytochrome/quinol oxidase subunit 1